MNLIIRKDMEYIKQKINSAQLNGSTVLISGATGLIGKYLVRYLIEYCDCKVIAVIRNKEKAQALWNDLNKEIYYIKSDIVNLEPANMSVDYMIHGASITSSKIFSLRPVEVIYTAIDGTKRMLEFAKRNPVKSFVYLSTMEIYGAPTNEEKIRETNGTNLDTMSVRTSYPESKRLCENLCAAYFSEYCVPTRVLRLTQTFGPGVQYDDPRVFAEFARCVIEGKDIILHTQGDTKRNYLYLADACTAILTVMMKGTSGQAYNAANEDTYCSIKQMAELAATQSVGAKIQVKIEPNQEIQGKLGYAPTLKMNLDTSKLRELGWKPEIGLSDMYKRMIACLVAERKGTNKWNQNI